ncbi:MAG: GntR family transcriptional regulator [Firmicutes bacterium]|nr:GntR family transcriptional regulator [Bacillota bacterium]
MKKKEIENSLPLANKVYNQLKKDIIELRKRPEEIILIGRVAEQMHVSRTPVKEALIQLKQEGLLVETSGGKLQVASLVFNDIREIFEIRQGLEGIAASIAAERVTSNQLDKLEQSLVNMNSLLQSGDYNSFFEEDSNFHNLVIEIANNKRMKELISQLDARLQRIRHLTLAIEKRLEKTVAEHTKVFECISKNDPQGARDAIIHHISIAKNDLSKLFETYDDLFSLMKLYQANPKFFLTDVNI